MRRAALVLVPLLLAGCTTQKAGAEPQSSPKTCGSPVSTEALPAWARAGFSGDGSGNPHVFGRDGNILGVIFGAPLRAAPAEGRANKILWVSKVPIDGDPLQIAATLDGTGEKVESHVTGGPGPSIVDLPKPGCWRLTLSWSGHTDTMDLTYS